jgi:hypothetical protein
MTMSSITVIIFLLGSIFLILCMAWVYILISSTELREITIPLYFSIKSWHIRLISDVLPVPGAE